MTGVCEGSLRDRETLHMKDFRLLAPAYKGGLAAGTLVSPMEFG